MGREASGDTFFGIHYWTPITSTVHYTLIWKNLALGQHRDQRFHQGALSGVRHGWKSIMTRPKVDPEKRQRIANACDACKRRKQKVRQNHIYPLACCWSLFCPMVWSYTVLLSCCSPDVSSKFLVAWNSSEDQLGLDILVQSCIESCSTKRVFVIQKISFKKIILGFIPWEPPLQYHVPREDVYLEKMACPP